MRSFDWLAFGGTVGAIFAVISAVASLVEQRTGRLDLLPVVSFITLFVSACLIGADFVPRRPKQTPDKRRPLALEATRAKS